MGLPQQAIDSILKLDKQARFDYAVKRIADARALYVLADQEGNWELLGDGEQEFLPIWTETEFAQLHAEENGEGLKPEPVDLQEFLAEDVPYLEENGMGIALFPLPGQVSVITLGPLQFAKIIDDILRERYGEELDLPYLNGGLRG